MKKYLNIGDVSGCLEVIGMFNESEEDLQETFRQWAEEEWNACLNRNDLDPPEMKKRFGLTKNEYEKFENNGKMPKSFVDKNRKNGSCHKLSWDNRFLWHRTQPNTRDALNTAYRRKALYKVRCGICGRIFYMDSISFGCSTWNSCIGAECLANAIESDEVDYSENLYDWTEKENALRVVDDRLTLLDKQINNCLSYYGDGKHGGLRIAYISDLHLTIT